jgi:Alpha-2-macroglobulin bait region domain
VQFEVNANRDMSVELFSIVIGRSGIVHSETHPEPNSENFEFLLKLTKEMAPSSQLIVYYMQPTGEIIYDSIKLQLEQLSENTVSNKKNS